MEMFVTKSGNRGSISNCSYTQKHINTKVTDVLRGEANLLCLLNSTEYDLLKYMYTLCDMPSHA